MAVNKVENSYPHEVHSPSWEAGDEQVLTIALSRGVFSRARITVSK